MERLKEYKDQQKNNPIENTFKKECVALMRNLIKDDNYLPVQFIYYMIIEFDIDNNNIIKLIPQNKIVDVNNLSLNYLLNNAYEIPNFIGYMTDEYNLEYFYNKTKSIYPDKIIKPILL